MEEYCLGWEIVSCLERCLQFRGVLIYNLYDSDVLLYYCVCVYNRNST